jgi:hypothetical protein
VNGDERRAKVIVGGVTANVSLRYDEHGFHINVLSQNNPRAVDSLKGALAHAVKTGTSFNLRDTVSYTRRGADVGYLRTAYLAAFAKLGYAYILRSALERVREQIRTPAAKTLQTVRLFSNDLGPFEKGFVVMHDPFPCLAVKIRDSMVCLPAPDGDDDQFYEMLAEMRKRKVVRQWHGSGTIRWPTRMELALDFAAPEPHSV